MKIFSRAYKKWADRIAVNTYELYWLNGKTVEDWGVNISLGPRWKDIAKVLIDKNFFRNIRFARVTFNLLANLEETRNAMHYLYNAYDIDSKGQHPNITFDVPGIGWGVELSAFKSSGTMFIEDL